MKHQRNANLALRAFFVGVAILLVIQGQPMMALAPLIVAATAEWKPPQHETQPDAKAHTNR